MKRLLLVVILIAIIGFTVANYYFIAHFSNPHAATITPMSVSAAPQNAFCQSNQLSGDIAAQGAAGNIYATLKLTNTGKTSCEVTLSNSITALFSARNIITHYEQNPEEKNIMLSPGATVYSQVHYPNGPQCQSTIVQQPIAFFYKTPQTDFAFKPTGPTAKLIVQACSSEAEKTIIDIWPISKTPITQ